MRDMMVIINLDGRASRSMAQKLRAEHIYCRILPAETAAGDIAALDPQGIVLAGGETGEAPEYPAAAELLESGLPMLAMGDAALTLCCALGGSLGEKAAEAGVVQVRYAGDDTLLREVEDGERYLPACRFMAPPASAEPIALADGGILGFRSGARPIYALAFQTERNDPDGTQLLMNFCCEVCGCTLWWSDQAFIDHAIQELERLSDGGEALCAISGGVDSGVCALLGSRALGSRLHCIFIDTGLLRDNEGDQVISFFQDEVGLEVQRINAAEEFLTALEGVTDPGEKEKIIFAHLRAILRREIGRYPQVRLLLQGTNYSDTLDEEPPVPMENQGARVRIAEPVRELFKEEIRHVAEALDMPKAICRRQSFPGSGLALRIIPAVTPERLEVLRIADSVFLDEIETAGQNRRLLKYFATLAADPMPGSGQYIVILRAVAAADGDTAVAARLPADLMERTTERILAALPQVSRVMYDLTPSRDYSHQGWQ